MNSKTQISMEEKIQQWKKKYGEVFKYEVDDKVCYLHKPDRKSLSAAAVIGKQDAMKYNEILLNNCWLEGDTDIKNDDKYFLGIASTLAELIEIKEGELKKL